MSDIRHVALIHGAWARGDSWGPARTAFEERGYIVRTPTPTVDFAAVTTPVMVIRCECYRVVPPQIAPKTAARYRQGTYVQVPRADHLPFFGAALPVTMGHIDDWIAENRVLGLSNPRN